METPVGQSALHCTWQCPMEQGGTVLPHPPARALLNVSSVTVSPAGSAGQEGQLRLAVCHKSYVHIEFWSVTTSSQSPSCPT